MISNLIGLYTFVIFVRIILSWFPINPGGALGQVTRVLFQVTEPVLGSAGPGPWRSTRGMGRDGSPFRCPVAVVRPAGPETRGGGALILFNLRRKK